VGSGRRHEEGHGEGGWRGRHYGLPCRHLGLEEAARGRRLAVTPQTTAATVAGNSYNLFVPLTLACWRMVHFGLLAYSTFLVFVGTIQDDSWSSVLQEGLTTPLCNLSRLETMTLTTAICITMQGDGHVNKYGFLAKQQNEMVCQHRPKALPAGISDCRARMAPLHTSTHSSNIPSLPTAATYLEPEEEWVRSMMT